MPKHNVFEIEVLSWDKHNPAKKKGYTHFMLANRFFDDWKIQNLTPTEKLAFVYILSVCADQRCSNVIVNAKQLLSKCGVTNKQCESIIQSLQRNQLLRVVKSADNRIEKNRIEKNRKELREFSENDKLNKNALPEKPSVLSENENLKSKNFIAKYCQLWKARYNSSPPITGKDAGIVKRVIKNLSFEKADFYLEAYFKMPDSFLFKAKHPLELFENKLKEIAAFSETGTFTTKTQVIQDDTIASNMILLEKVRRGEI